MEATLRVCDVRTGKERAAYRLAGMPAGAPMTLAVSPDGKLLAVSLDDRVALLRLDRLNQSPR
jgi:hypothetical protein